MPFEHRLTVRFHEVDRAGIAFFGRIFFYCHEAYEELLVHIGYRLVDIFDQEGWGMPLVHAEADFERPMRMGDELIVQVQASRVGNTSVTLDFTILGAEDRVLRATARHVHVCVDMSDFAAREVPERLRKALAGFEEATNSSP